MKKKKVFKICIIILIAIITLTFIVHERRKSYYRNYENLNNSSSNKNQENDNENKLEKENDNLIFIIEDTLSFTAEDIDKFDVDKIDGFPDILHHGTSTVESILYYLAGYDEYETNAYDQEINAYRDYSAIYSQYVNNDRTIINARITEKYKTLKLNYYREMTCDSYLNEEDKQYLNNISQYTYKYSDIMREYRTSSETLFSSLNKCMTEYITKYNEKKDPDTIFFDAKYDSSSFSVPINIYDIISYHKIKKITFDEELDFIKSVIEYYRYYNYEDMDSESTVYVHIYPVEYDGIYIFPYLVHDFVYDKNIDYDSIMEEYNNKAEQYPDTYMNYNLKPLQYEGPGYVLYNSDIQFCDFIKHLFSNSLLSKDLITGNETDNYGHVKEIGVKKAIEENISKK